MHLSKVIKLYLFFLLYQRVISARQLFVKNQNLTFDNILKKFIVDFEKAYLRKRDPRHITIVGATNDDLEHIQPLFKRYPYILCEDAENCAYEEKFSRGSFVFIFLHDLSKETYEKNTDILSLYRKCIILFISDGIIRIEDISLIFTLAVRQNARYTELAHIGTNEIELYSNFLSADCSMKVRLVTVWKPGVHLNTINTWAFQSKNLNGCPVHVSSLTFRPKMMIEEKDNGILAIVSGREGRLLLAVAEKLNFTLVLKYPKLVDRMKYSRKMSIINDVVSGNVEIGIGRIRPTNDLRQVVAISVAYDEECVTWGIPRIVSWPNDIVWVEFSWQIWVSVGFTFAVNCAFGYVHENLNFSKNGKRKRLGFVTVVFDVLTVHVGNPVIHVSSLVGGRSMLIVFLYYVIVLTTAYKTSLAATLATNRGTSLIVDAEGIINANFTVGGSLYDYNILKDQVNESELTSKFLERFEINNNDSETIHKLKYDHDYAFLARRSSLNYHLRNLIKLHKSITYDILNDCVLAYPTVIAFDNKSFIKTPTDSIIQRLVESGILEFWDLDGIDTDKTLKHRNAEKYFDNRAVYKFRNMFILYVECIALCLVIFLIELLVSSFDLRRRE